MKTDEQKRQDAKDAFIQRHGQRAYDQKKAAAKKALGRSFFTRLRGEARMRRLEGKDPAVTIIAKLEGWV